MKINAVTMDIQLKVTIFFVVWLGNTNKCYMMTSSSEPNLGTVTLEVSGTDASESSDPDLDGTSLVDNPTTVAPDIDKSFDNTTEVNEINIDTKSCYKEHTPDYFLPILRCPDVSAYNKYLIQSENGSLEIAVGHVGGFLNLTLEYGQLKLESLKISEANLTSLDSLDRSSKSKFLYALKKLDLSGNPEFDVESLVNIGKLDFLTHLTMRGTAMKKLDEQLPHLLQNYPNLEYLDVSYTGIISLHGPDILTSSKFLQALKKLDLSGNPKFDAQSLVEIGKLDSLTHLIMSGTALKKPYKHLPHLLNNYPNLEYLDVSYTGILYLDDPYIFTSSKKLKHIDVSGNDKLSFIEIHIDTIQQLEYLNLSNCNLREIRVEGERKMDQGNMKMLDVSNNHLTEISPLMLDALGNNNVFLNISRNAFGEASENCQTFYLWHFLQSHPIDDSRVRVVGREELQFREKIALSKCQWNLCPPDCRCNRKEKTVDCRNIGLKTLPWVIPSSAEILLLQNNDLTSLEGIQSSALCNLKTLDVGYNKISQMLPVNTIQGNCKCVSKEAQAFTTSDCFPQHLEKLKLKNNVLQNNTINSCKILAPVRELDLSGNEITNFEHVCAVPLERLQILNLTGNEIVNKVEHSQYPNLIVLHPDNLNVSISNDTGETNNDIHTTPVTHPTTPISTENNDSSTITESNRSD